MQQALGALIVELDLIKQLFSGFDLRPFTDKDAKPLDRLDCLQNAAEYVLSLNKMYNVAAEGAKKPKVVDAKPSSSPISSGLKWPTTSANPQTC